MSLYLCIPWSGLYSSNCINLAVYEFTHAETLQAFAEAVERGVDVKIIRHCKGVYHPKVKRNSIVKDDNGKAITEWIPDSTTLEADKAIKAVGFRSIDHAKTWHHGTFVERRHSSALMHNKFIILLQDGEPSQVWTGSTNFTDGGIYGQSKINVDYARISDIYVHITHMRLYSSPHTYHKVTLAIS